MQCDQGENRGEFLCSVTHPGDKKDNFDHSFIKKLAPKRFNKFEFSHSVGASGCILVGWNNSIFTGETIHNNRFAITIKFK